MQNYGLKYRHAGLPVEFPISENTHTSPLQNGNINILSKPNPMNKIETLNLKCTLTDEEMLAISKEMSEHINKKKQAEDNLSSFSAQIKAEIKGHDAIINKTATLIHSGSEYRNIQCQVIIDTVHDTVSWIRSDTGELCQHEKPIPQRYLQTQLEIDPL